MAGLTRGRTPEAVCYDRCSNRATRYTLDEAGQLGATVQSPNPEDRFTQLVRRHLTSSDTVLDIGCGDGEWLLTMVAPWVASVVGLDTGRPGLSRADVERLRCRLVHVGFVQGDGRRIPLSDNSVTAVISRRGPWTEDETFFREGCRVLRPGGIALEITIGQENSQEIYTVFRRGQMYGEPERGSRLDRLLAMYRGHGLRPIVAQSLVTQEHLPGRKGLVFRLETTPSVEDFDPVADAELVDQVVSRYSGRRGVRLTMHRLILVARKEAA